VLDISMPAKDGIDTSTEISELGLPTRVLIVTMHSDEQYALRTLRAGASGFCCKGARSEELVHAVREVAAGRRYLPPHIQNTFADRYLTPATKDSPVSILSQREFQVMCHLAAGMTNREIAEQLQISVKTVDTHRGHVLKKLQLRNNSDITRFAIRHGFVEA
jgi:DNA-binding NarL/FixJ family response regulator